MKVILYVDDSPDDLLLMANACRIAAARFRLETIEGGEAAIRHLEALPGQSVPDFALLDLKMPGVGGLEMLRWMRSHPNTRAVPVALYTSSLLKEDAAQGYSHGAAWFIPKPSGLTEMISLARVLDQCLHQEASPCQALRAWSLGLQNLNAG